MCPPKLKLNLRWDYMWRWGKGASEGAQIMKGISAFSKEAPKSIFTPASYVRL